MLQSLGLQRVGHELESPTMWILCLFVCLAALHCACDLSSLNRDQTHAPCSGSMESSPLGHQGVPLTRFLSIYPDTLIIFVLRTLLPHYLLQMYTLLFMGQKRNPL